MTFTTGTQIKGTYSIGSKRARFQGTIIEIKPNLYEPGFAEAEIELSEGTGILRDRFGICMKLYQGQVSDNRYSNVKLNK